MASQPNIEYEAAKFLQKLIHDSKDEPDKLATKLYVILQHMKASGKENSLPYQVISRAMETVVSQHGFDMESLQQPSNPVNNEAQTGHAINPHPAGGAPQDSNSSLRENDLCQPPAGPSNVVPDTLPGSHRSAISTEHESPLSIDTKSANSASYERRDSSSWEQQQTQKDNRSSVKRKRSELSASDAHIDNSQQQLDTHIAIADAKKGLMNRMDLPRPFPGTSSLEPSAGKGVVDSDYWRQKLPKDASISFAEASSQGHLSSTNPREMPMGGAACNLSDMSTRSGNPRDAGKSPIFSAPAYIMPFKEHHLKQLRAQCLVFLAFRNGLMPKRPHLEIALGSTSSKEASSVEGVLSDPVDNKVKEMTMSESRSNPDIASQQGNVVALKTERAPPASFFATAGLKSDMHKKEGENGTSSVEKSLPYADPAVNDEERKQLLNTQRAMEVETGNHENRVPAILPIQPNDSSSMKNSSNHDNGHLHSGAMNQESPVMGLSKQLTPETIRWAAVGVHNEAPRGPYSSSVAQHELLARKEISANHSQGLGEIANQGHQYVDGNLSNPWKPRQDFNNEKQTTVPTRDSTTMLLKHGSNADVNHMIGGNTAFHQLDKIYGPGETDKLSGGVPPPKYTTSEKWIMIQQKRRIVNEENWMQKQQKVNQRITVRFNELKETVNSSEDISAKTKSVIELKKLQLLGLQRRLRSNIVNDFFKPITMEIDRLKAIKKHRIGRRMKHVERYEQRMKEERQKRLRERQKEFFSEVEFHRERLDDVFKFKRERCKGFNRYVKEFHKRKERVHREKIDRIQREKINLLKINDVEGYLRMVQDAKSDRVNKLLKETEKYLQKLSAKLQEAKSISKQFETDTDENQSASLESSDIVTETDESDQAKHYKESNEKYYLMAHSIKENIPEQPTGLRGGKLREYQMNGLRWLVSLYNNHLNGILADEMGLGKTVQVISLICYLMETKNDRGPFLVVVPSSVLPGWESELNFWAPDVNKIIYSGPPEERRRLFKERIVHQKFNVLLTTYEYLMNKHDRPKLTKVQWRYIIIDEGHRIKNASCKLNADLKLYQSSHRLLLTGTPLQNNLEELWALLNFLLPNIFNSSEDFSQWFNKPFESNGDNSPDEALLSEEENLLIINRLHQVLRPFVLRRLKHKVENQLPEKIERLVRCEASAYQKLLMKRVEDNLGSLGNSKARAVHNSVMELRNICNHPYISQLHSDEVDTLIPKHFLPPIVRLCGKLEMLDRLLPKLKATNHRVLLFSTMTRLLDVMEEYLAWKNYRYLRLDGHTSGLDRGALIDQFNRPDSPYFIFLLSIRAGGVGVNLQAADTVIIFDTDWNPQVDLQAQARAHRIGQKKDVLVLRLETVNTVEEQVRASAEHKLGVANQSITAGFFDNNTSAEDRREYLEALLRESKKEEAAPVLADDALNDLLARSELEIDVFESIDLERHEDEMATWKTLAMEQGTDDSHVIPPLPPRLVTEDDLKLFLEAMKAYEVSELASDGGLKRKAGSSGSFDTQYYGRGKRSREVRSYEEQWTEEEFEKLCQTELADAHKLNDELKDPQLQLEASIVATKIEVAGPTSQIQQAPLTLSVESSAPVNSVDTPPVKRGRGRPRRIPLNSPSVQSPAKPIVDLPKVSNPMPSIVDASHDPAATKDIDKATHQADVGMTPKSDATQSMPPPNSGVQIASSGPSISAQSKMQNPKGQGNGEPVRRRGRKPKILTQPEQSVKPLSVDGAASLTVLPASSEQSKPILELKESVAEPSAVSSALPIVSGNIQDVAVDSASHCETAASGSLSNSHAPEIQKLQTGEEVTTAVEPSPCTSARPGASETSVTEVSCTPIVSAGPGSSSMPCTSAKPPGKRQRRKSQIGPESSAAGPAASETAANEISLSTSRGSDNMPGRRQTRRSVGRGKGQSLGATTPAVTSTEQPKPSESSLSLPISVPQTGQSLSVTSTTPAVTSTEQPKPSESNLSLPISIPQTGISVPAMPGSGNVGVGSQVVDIPVITLAPGSGYVQGSSVSQSSTVSLHNLSSAPAILAAGETAPRRRGRKKGWSANSAGKGLAAGGQKKDVVEIKKTTGEDSSIIQSPALVGRDTTLEDQPGVSSHVLKPNELSVAASSLEKSDLEAKNIDRGLEVNNVSLSKEVGMSDSIADVTPTSTTASGVTSSVPCQTTRYIVLALKTSARIDENPSMTSETVSRKNKDSKPDINVDECKIRQPEVNVASNAGSTSNLDEDMNAPPGFDTPHAYSADTTTVGMSLPSEDNTGKEDSLAADKGTIQMDSRHMVDSDQNMMDPVQVLDEDSAPPGFDYDDASGLKTRVAESLNCERRDSSDASFAQAQDSKHPPVLTGASDEIVEDYSDLAEKDSVPRDLAEKNLVPRDLAEKNLVPPGFGVTQAHLEEGGSAKKVSSEACVVPIENRATGGFWQVQTTAEGPKNQSPNQEATGKLPFLQTETSVGDNSGEKSGNESLGEGAIIVQEVKGHVHQETVMSDLSVHSEKSYSENGVPSSDTNNADTKVTTEQNMGNMRVEHYCQIRPDASANVNIDDDVELMTCEQESIQRPDVESSSRDGIQTQDSGKIFIHDNKEGGHLKELHVASEAQISYLGGPPAVSELEICEQGSNNKENLMACVPELGQATADTSTNGHNLVPTGNVALHNEDDSSCLPESGFNSNLTSKDKEEQHEGRDDSAHQQATCSSPGTEAQKNKMDIEIPSDADCGVLEEGRDDSAHPQAICSSPGMEAQKNNRDTELPSDAGCGVMEEGRDDSADPQATCSSPDTEAQKNNMDTEIPSDANCGVLEQGQDATCASAGTEEKMDKLDTEMPSDADCGVVNGGHVDDDAHTQTTSASLNTEAQMDKMDSEMPSDVDDGVVNNKIDISQNTELQEESIGHTIQEIEEQDTSPSRDATQKNEVDHESLPDDSANLQATCVSSDTEAQKNNLDPEVPSNADCGIVNEGQADSIQPQTTCASSGTEAQKNKMDSEMPSHADFGVVNSKIDFPQNNELEEESKGRTIQEIEEQDTSLSPVATQKNEADPEILPDVDFYGLKNKIEAPLNTESREETREPTVQEIDQQGVSLTMVGTQLEATSNISSEIQKEEADTEMLPLAELCAPESGTKILDESKEITALETEQQDLSESPVASQLEAHCTVSVSEVQKDEMDDFKPCDDPDELHEQELDVEAEIKPTDINSEIKGQEMLVDECLQASSEIGVPDELHEQELDVKAVIKPTDMNSEIKGQEMLVDVCLQASSETGAFQECEDLVGKETVSQVNEAGCINSETESKVETNSEIPADAEAEAGNLNDERALGFQPEAAVDTQAKEHEDQVGKWTPSQVNKEAGWIISESVSKLETNSELPTDAEAGTSNDEPALGFQPEAAADTQATDSDMNDFKPCENPEELQELGVENVIKATGTNTEVEGQEILVDNCIQTSNEIGDFQESEDHAGKEIISQINKEAVYTNTEVKIETDSEIPADKASTLRDEPQFVTQPEAAADTQSTDNEMVDFKSCADPSELQGLDVEAEVKPTDTNSEIEDQDMLVDERIQESNEIGAFQECVGQVGKELISQVNTEAGGIKSEAKIETDSEISAGVEAGTLNDEQTFDAQPEADPIVIPETESGKSESVAQLPINTEHITDGELKKNETEAGGIKSETKIETDFEISAGTLKDEQTFDAQSEADPIVIPETESQKSESVAQLPINTEHITDTELQKNETDAEADAIVVAETESGKSESVAELPITTEPLTDVELHKNETEVDFNVASEAECKKSDAVAELPTNTEPFTDVELQKNETDSEADSSVVPEIERKKIDFVAELPINTEHLTAAEMQVDSSAEYSNDRSQNPTEASTLVLEIGCQKSGCNATASASEGENGNSQISQDKDDESRNAIIDAQLEVVSTVSETECQKDEINASAKEDDVTPSIETAISDIEGEKNEDKAEIVAVSASTVSETECQKDEINASANEDNVAPSVETSISEIKGGKNEDKAEIVAVSASTVSETECQKDEINASAKEDDVTPSVETTISDIKGDKNENKAEIVAVSDARDQEIEKSAPESPKTES